MLYLAIGEWVISNVLFSAAFLVAGIGIVGIAVYVLRGDRLNREAMGEMGDSHVDRAAGVHEEH